MHHNPRCLRHEALPPHSQPTAYDADATQPTSLAQNVRRGQSNAQRLTAHGAAEA